MRTTPLLMTLGFMLAAALPAVGQMLPEDPMAPGQPPAGQPVPGPEGEPAEPGAPADPGAMPAMPFDLELETDGQEQPGYVLDGMIGQVNGEPIYANRVLGPLDQQLAALARQHPPEVFAQHAQPLIASRLGEMVTDALILSQAQRDLDEQERQWLTMAVQHQRREMIRRYGQGAPSVAEATLQRQRGQSLDQALRDFRHELIVQRYLSERLFPRINVTRREIERYYRDNHERFNPPASRTIRMIQTEAQSDTERIAQWLSEGMDFKRLARSDMNLFLPQEGGRMQTSSERPLASDVLNDAIDELDEGEHAGPIRSGGRDWFVKLEQVETGEQQPLIEVQRQIEQHLQARQFNELSMEHRQQLMQDASLEAMDRMGSTLMQIVMNRYAHQGEPHAGAGQP